MGILKKNYGLTQWLVRLAYIVSNIFCRWIFYRSAAVYLGEAFGINAKVCGSVWFVLVSALFSAIIMLILIRMVALWVLKYTRMYNLPAQEIALFVVLFAALKNLIAGLFRLIYLLSPLFIGWGEVLFDFIGLIVAVVCFYSFVQKKYLAKGNKAFFFKTVFSLTAIFLAAKLFMGFTAL